MRHFGIVLTAALVCVTVALVAPGGTIPVAALRAQQAAALIRAMLRAAAFTILYTLLKRNQSKESDTRQRRSVEESWVSSDILALDCSRLC